MKAHLAREYGSVEQVTEALIDQAGGVKRVCFILGRSKSAVYGYADPKADSQMTLGQGAALTRPGVDALADWYAALAGGVFVPMPLPAQGAVARDVARLAQKSGAFLSGAVQSLADGSVCAAEARAMLADLDDVLRCAAHIRGRLDGIVKGDAACA